MTHTHPDHIGAVPHLKKLWPHLKVMGSAGAVKSFKRLSEKKEALKNSFGLTIAFPAFDWPKEDFRAPPELDHYDFTVDHVLEEGERIRLSPKIVWSGYTTAGSFPLPHRLKR